MDEYKFRLHTRHGILCNEESDRVYSEQHEQDVITHLPHATESNWGYRIYEHSDKDPTVEIITDVIASCIFTGLKTKNGKDIYDGDILIVAEYRNKAMKLFNYDERELFSIEECIGDKVSTYETEVKYIDGEFMLKDNGVDFNTPLACLFGDMRHSSPIFKFELIGNIYEK